MLAVAKAVKSPALEDAAAPLGVAAMLLYLAALCLRARGHIRSNDENDSLEGDENHEER